MNFKVGDEVTNGKGIFHTIIRIDENGKAIVYVPRFKRSMSLKQGKWRLVTKLDRVLYEI